MNYSRKACELVEVLNSGPMRRSHAVAISSQDLVVRLEDIGTVERFGSPMMVRIGKTSIPMQPKAAAPKSPAIPRKSHLLESVLTILGDHELTGGEIAAQLGRPHKHISGWLLDSCERGFLIRRRRHGELAGRTQKCEFYLYRRA